MNAHITLLRGPTHQGRLGSPSCLGFLPPYFVCCAQCNLGGREALVLCGEERWETIQQILIPVRSRRLEAWPECGSQAQAAQSSVAECLWSCDTDLHVIPASSEVVSL